MFTGLVEEIGKLVTIQVIDEQTVLTIEADVVLQGIKLGDSIATNGVCLTVTHFDLSKRTFTVGLSPETLRLTNLGDQTVGSCVNLERSLAAGDRMGGHFVQGHVDGTGKILKFQREKDSLWVTIHAGPELLKFIVPKGYISCDGTSLTVCEVNRTELFFTFMLVKYTQGKIVLPTKRPGDRVNLEVDIMGKQIVNYLENLPSLPGTARL